MQFFKAGMRARSSAAIMVVAALGACSEPFDLDLRGNLGGFSTASAARGAQTTRPQPNEKGLISYPNYQVAVARRGDRLTDLAQRIDYPVAELARYNGLQANDPLREGEVVALPRRLEAVTPLPHQNSSGVDIARLASNAIDTATDARPLPVTTTPLTPAPAKQPAKSGLEPLRHKVERGETVYSISRLYQVPVKTLAEWNALGADLSVREGQYLLVPTGNPRRAAPAPAAEPNRGALPPAAVAKPGQGTVTPKPPRAAAPKQDERVAALKPATDASPAPASSNSAQMIYPVIGKIIRPYKKGKNEGIDIAADPGTPVRAAASGRVAAITADADRVPIVVLRHANNILTVYANVGDIAVKKGDQVDQGTTLAALRPGSDAYLHFEVRDGFDSIDPAPFLD